jgi:hypothetical protein
LTFFVSAIFDRKASDIKLLLAGDGRGTGKKKFSVPGSAETYISAQPDKHGYLTDRPYTFPMICEIVIYYIHHKTIDNSAE